jgi:rhodanese-related sulfurtransferase
MTQERSNLLPACGFILALAVICALAFNLLMPQGIGILPPEMKNPLWQWVSPQEAAKLYDQGVLFVDARDPGKYKLAHIKGAVNLYPEELEGVFKLLKRKFVDAGMVVVHGRKFSTFPAAIVAQNLRQKGLKKVLVVKGDLEELKAAGLPLRLPRRRASR